MEVSLPSQWLAGVVFPLILIVSITAIAGRYRSSHDLERLQMRWLVAAFGSIAVAVPVGLVIATVFDPNAEVAWVPASLAFLLPPIAIGIAVTRYRLYEIDRLISRGLSWAVLSGLLLAVYAGAILLLQTLLGDLIQGQTVAVAGSTLIAAALFQPLRRRVQSAVDHRFNRARYDAERTAIDFAERLRNEVDLPALGATSRASSIPPSTQPRSACGSAAPARRPRNDSRTTDPQHEARHDSPDPSDPPSARSQRSGHRGRRRSGQRNRSPSRRRPSTQ